LLYVPSADGRLRMPVLIPVSHGERLFYRLRVRWTPGLWFLGAWLVVPGLVWMVLQGLYLLDWYSFTGTANLTVLAVTAGVAAAYIGGFLLDHRWIGRNCIVWRYRAALRAVDVTFPERHRQAFAAWFEALRAWDAAGRPVGDPDASEESWASGVAAGWDQDPTLLK
ncbi:MAG: hypothetical protein ACREJ2_02485, partial [Planctomycetota bacterium]